MKWHYKSSKYILLALLMSSILCASNNKTIAEELQIKLESVLKEIDTLIGEAKCDNDNQCGYIEIGRKPCGGPAGHKIYSSNNTELPLLFEASKDHAKLSKEYNIITGLVSDCSVVMPPIVKCNIKCVSE